MKIKTKDLSHLGMYAQNLRAIEPTDVRHAGPN